MTKKNFNQNLTLQSKRGRNFPVEVSVQVVAKDKNGRFVTNENLPMPIFNSHTSWAYVPPKMVKLSLWERITGKISDKTYDKIDSEVSSARSKTAKAMEHRIISVANSDYEAKKDKSLGLLY